MLTTIEEVFNKVIEKDLVGVSEFNTLEEDVSMSLLDAASQQIAVMNCQSMFVSITIDSAIIFWRPGIP